MIESLNAIAGAWWSWISAMFWQVGLLIVLIACVDRLIRRWAWPQLRYALWSLILIKLILPPTLSLPGSVVPALKPATQQAWRAIQPKKHVAIADCGLGSTDSTCTVNTPAPIVTPPWTTKAYVETKRFDRAAPFYPQSHPQAPLEAATLPQSPRSGGAELIPAQAGEIRNPKLAWPFHAMAIWLAGTLILGTWLLLRLHALAGRSANRAAGASLPQSFYNQMAGCAARLGLRRVPRVVVVKKLATPAVFGVFRPVLLMPKGYLRKLSRRDTEHMLLHELAHIRRGDLHMHGLYMLLQIIHWYNPLLWLVRRQLHHLRELSCDATVAELLREQTSAYRQTLLETARRFLARSTEPGLGLLGLFEDSNRLAVRLRWLQRPTWRYRTMKRITVLTIALLMFTCVLPMAPGRSNTAAAVENETSAPTQTEDPQLQELKIKLEKLEIERQKLQTQLQALAQARQAAAEAKAQSGAARVEAAKAKDAAAEAKVKAQEAKLKAMQAHMNTNENQQWAEEMQAWAEKMEQWQHSPEMQQWQKEMEHWEHSDAFKQWEKDVQKWSEQVAKHYGKADADADAGSADATPAAPMPAMPAMPVLPAMPAAPAPAAAHPMPHPMPMPMPVPMPKVKAKQDHDDKAKAEATMNFTSPLVDGGLLIVENRVGGITVCGADTDECHIEVTVTARAETEEEAEAMAQAIDMKYDSSDSRIFIKPVKSDGDEWKNVDVAFEITVPHRASLQLAADVGAVYLRDIQGQVKVKANVGAVITENVRGDVDVETNVGDIQFIAPDGLSAKVTAATNIGAIKSDLPVEVSAKSQAGQFGVSMGSNASGTLGTGEGTVKLKSNVGSIAIRSKGSADTLTQLKKISSSHVAPAVVTTGDAAGAMVVSARSGDSVSVSLDTGLTHSDRVTGTVTLNGKPGVRMIESIRETQEGDRHVLRRMESETVQWVPGSTVEVANENGTIVVKGTDSDVCHVQAILTVKGPAAETTRKLSKAISLDVTPKDKGLALAIVRPKEMPAEHSYRVDLQILVPRHANLNVVNEDGDVKIAEVDGQVKLALEDGDILCERLTGSMKIMLEDGGLKIDRCTPSDCQIVMEDGNIDCNDISGDLDVQLEDGQVKIVYGDNVPESCAVRVTLDDGSIQFSAPSAMFPADDSAKVRRKEDGAEWRTTVKTSQGSRAVTLRVGDGSIKVDQR